MSKTTFTLNFRMGDFQHQLDDRPDKNATLSLVKERSNEAPYLKASVGQHTRVVAKTELENLATHILNTLDEYDRQLRALRLAKDKVFSLLFDNGGRDKKSAIRVLNGNAPYYRPSVAVQVNNGDVHFVSETDLRRLAKDILKAVKKKKR